MTIKYKLISWLEMTLFKPRGVASNLFVFLLLPLSFVYGFLMLIRRWFAFKKKFDLPIISIGNITLGGNGKTPFIISLSKYFSDIAIISRGYGRKSSGLVKVSIGGKLQCSVDICGDEAYLMAKMCPNATVIVSKDREKAIRLSKKLGAKIVLLDDGFSKVCISKVEILLHSIEKPTYPFCLPAGSYREFPFVKRYADLNLEEGIDFIKEVRVDSKDCDLVLITSISKPQRLIKYLPKNVKKYHFFPDHHNFSKNEIETLMRVYPNSKILCTQKDAVKLERYNFELIIMKLEIQIKEPVVKKIKSYLNYNSL